MVASKHEERTVGGDPAWGGDSDLTPAQDPELSRSPSEGSDGDTEPGAPAGDAASKKRGKPKRDRESEERRSKGQILAKTKAKDEAIEKLTQEKEDLEEQLKVLQDNRLRLAAEYDNYRKRTRKEWELLRQQSIAEVLTEALGVVDDFERALSAADDASADFVQGVRLIYNNLMALLDRFGVQRMEITGQPFDPNLHMAVAQIESADVESGHIIEVVQHGYVMNDMVLRPAQVVIAK